MGFRPKNKTTLILTHSLWINQNYIRLAKVAKDVSPNDWRDLITHYCLYLDTNWVQFSVIPNNVERLKFSTTWLSNNARWPKSAFKLEFKVNNMEAQWDIPDTEVEEPNIDILDISDERNNRVIDPQIKWMVISMKEWIKDTTDKWGEVRGTNLIKLRYVYLNDLTLTERVLYDLHFTEGLSVRKIAKQLDLPISGTYQMVRVLKNKLKNHVVA